MPKSHRAIIVVDLAFGDCGKGTIVDYLVRLHGARTVVRFNGGPQAAHNVVLEDGRHHTFAQFGSGSLVPGVRTLLSRFMLIEPYAMLNEAAHLVQLGVSNPLGGLVIDARCRVITPAHLAANRLRELARGANAHGSCGMGIGELMQDQLDHPELILVAADLGNAAKVSQKLRATCEFKRAQVSDAIGAFKDHPAVKSIIAVLQDLTWIDTAIRRYRQVFSESQVLDERDIAAELAANNPIIFEGAQGVLLDENWGFHPHTTWSTTTCENADALLDDSSSPAERLHLGVLRTYFTRHGNGPLVTEDGSLAGGLPEAHNDAHGWQGSFRVGAFDAVAARYALRVCGNVDALAVTHVDRLPQLPQIVCNAYQSDRIISDLPVGKRGDLAQQEGLTRMLQRCTPVATSIDTSAAHTFLGQLEDLLRCPIAITSAGPTAADKRIVPQSEAASSSS